jgi:hypothetical protein
MNFRNDSEGLKNLEIISGFGDVGPGGRETEARHRGAAHWADCSVWQPERLAVPLLSDSFCLPPKQIEKSGHPPTGTDRAASVEFIPSLM